MSLTLHYHPLSSFCWKALIGLYELEVPFEKHLVDLSDAEARAAFVRLWPIGKFPVLHDHARDRVVPESSSSTSRRERAPGRWATSSRSPIARRCRRSSTRTRSSRSQAAGRTWPRTSRGSRRDPVARVLREAEPYFEMFPG